MDEVRVNEELQVGQVWEWTLGEEPWNFQELYLLLRQRGEEMGFSVAFENAEDVWEALNLETGVVEFVTPMLTAGVWERLS